MSVMNQKVRVKRTRREVVHAARAVGEVVMMSEMMSEYIKRPSGNWRATRLARVEVTRQMDLWISKE